MARTRLETALAEGLTLPDGPVLVLRPPQDADLSALPRERVVIRHGFRPDSDAWDGAGYAIDDGGAGPAVAVACVPRSKTLARALIAEAADAAALVVVDGHRDNGVDSIWREVRVRRPDAQGLTQGHGRLFWFEGGAGFEDWRATGPVQGPDGLFTQGGVFSEGGADAGSLLLAEALPTRLPGRMADFGAGVGTLALAALSREGVASLDLIEGESLALDCARLNVVDARANFLWADAVTGTFGPYDGIVMNPPFHPSRAPDAGLGRAFIAAAARVLTPQGQLWMVANRFLAYETALAEAFRDVEAIGGDAAFKLFHAKVPARAPSRSAGRAKPAVTRTRGRQAAG